MDKDLENASLSRARGDRVTIDHPIDNIPEIDDADITVEEILESHIGPNDAQERVESIIDSYGRSDDIAVWLRSPTKGEDFVCVAVSSETIDIGSLLNELPNAVCVRTNKNDEFIESCLDVYVKNDR